MQNNLPQRKSPRLKDYDYTQEGAYYVTICTHKRYLWFGNITENTIKLSPQGQIAYDRWLHIPHHHPHVDLDMFVVMPNHIHGIIVITKPPLTDAIIKSTDDAGIVPTQSPKKRTLVAGSLSAVIGSYKSGVTRRIREQQGDLDDTLWQKSFYEHIIRNDDDLNRIRKYILHNPAKWAEDEFYRATS